LKEEQLNSNVDVKLVPSEEPDHLIAIVERELSPEQEAAIVRVIQKKAPRPVEVTVQVGEI